MACARVLKWKRLAQQPGDSDDASTAPQLADFTRFADATRLEWLTTEWPALILWVGWASLLLLALVIAVRHSWWCLLLLLPWWLVGGGKAMAIIRFLVAGAERNELLVRGDGAMFASVNQQAPEYAHWVAFVNEGKVFVLWGGDGRYRLVIPRRALSAADYLAVRDRVGIDLAKESGAVGEEARLRGSRDRMPRQTAGG